MTLCIVRVLAMGQTRLLPLFRFQCVDAPRPCEHTTCRWHLSKENGDWISSGDSCTLDIADRGPHDLDVISRAMGITSEGVRRIEIRALEKLRASGAARALFEELDGVTTGRQYATTREVLLLDVAPNEAKE